jgi:hypothetical protein
MNGSPTGRGLQLCTRKAVNEGVHLALARRASKREIQAPDHVFVMLV